MSGRSVLVFLLFVCFKIKVVSNVNPLQYSAAAALAIVKETVQIKLQHAGNPWA